MAISIAVKSLNTMQNRITSVWDGFLNIGKKPNWILYGDCITGRLPCRVLKDVNELFMDTGLGREGYSIIGQGKIDEILSVKSSDRREIFEEAAGISRYRHRKEEAERRLERTDENLVRVNDKIAELELQEIGRAHV